MEEARMMKKKNEKQNIENDYDKYYFMCASATKQ